MDRADTVLSGYITDIEETILTVERETGRALEKEVMLNSKVTWKDLGTGDYLIENRPIVATGTYSPWLNQGFRYASSFAANNLAEKIVEQMEIKW